mmetsp:Transcript_744/g.1485  ORF Transcript_744/g.1485 Transcript_744/m.1485 type:complete len:153 (+) Transcript_744:2063-2521(+)
MYGTPTTVHSLCLRWLEERTTFGRLERSCASHFYKTKKQKSELTTILLRYNMVWYTSDFSKREFVFGTHESAAKWLTQPKKKEKRPRVCALFGIKRKRETTKEESFLPPLFRPSRCWMMDLILYTIGHSAKTQREYSVDHHSSSQFLFFFIE